MFRRKPTDSLFLSASVVPGVFQGCAKFVDLAFQFLDTLILKVQIIVHGPSKVSNLKVVVSQERNRIEENKNRASYHKAT